MSIDPTLNMPYSPTSTDKIFMDIKGASTKVKRRKILKVTRIYTQK